MSYRVLPKVVGAVTSTLLIEVGERAVRSSKLSTKKQEVAMVAIRATVSAVVQVCLAVIVSDSAGRHNTVAGGPTDEE